MRPARVVGEEALLRGLGHPLLTGRRADRRRSSGRTLRPTPPLLGACPGRSESTSTWAAWKVPRQQRSARP